MSDDAQLIDLALKGQTDAFGQVGSEVSGIGCSIRFSIWLVMAEDARDIVQEALVQAFLKLSFVSAAQCILHMAVSDCL